MHWILVTFVMLVCGSSLSNDQAITPIAIKGPAVIESHLPNGRSSPEDLTYPAEVIGYGEDGKHVKEIRAVPNHVLAAFDGQLLGGDRGEWGGELVFRDKNAVFHRMLEQNVKAIIPMPFGIAVFTGLAHMGMSDGDIYVVRQDGNQLPRASLLHHLSGVPSDIQWTVNDELVFTVHPGIRTKRDFLSPPQAECDLLDKKGELRPLPCASAIRR